MRDIKGDGTRVNPTSAALPLKARGILRHRAAITARRLRPWVLLQDNLKGFHETVRKLAAVCAFVWITWLVPLIKNP